MSEIIENKSGNPASENETPWQKMADKALAEITNSGERPTQFDLLDKYVAWSKNNDTKKDASRFG